jgi:hypothetical protein
VQMPNQDWESFDRIRSKEGCHLLDEIQVQKNSNPNDGRDASTSYYDHTPCNLINKKCSNESFFPQLAREQICH